MANRSYLYSLSSRPTSYSDRPETIRGLSEWNYRIPLSFLILVSGSTEVGASLISDGFDDEPRAQKTRLFSLTGRFDEGLKRLERFSAVATLVSKGTEALAAATAETFRYLEEHRGAFVLLQTIELDVMGPTRSFEGLAKKHASHASSFGAAIDAWPESNELAAEKLLATRHDEFIGARFDSLFDDRESLNPLGLSFWNPILYFAPSNRAEFEAQRFAGKDLSKPKPYSAKDRFAVDEVIEHPVFGIGIVRAVSGNKIDVEFKTSDKTLVHAR